jgi:uncharacterized membrane protein YdbT with pleckstrin-like domain
METPQAVQGTASDEVLWEGNPSLWANPFTLTLVILLSLVLVGIPWLVYLIIKAKTTRYKVTRKRVSVTTGIFNIDQRELQRDHIRSVNFKKNLFGLGQVEIASSASDEDAVIVLSDIWKPDEVAQLVRGE